MSTSDPDLGNGYEMCGRYALRISLPDLARIFGLEPQPELAATERYNIAPTQQIPVLREDDAGKAQFFTMRWGLVPAWSKGPDSRYAMFNARIEGIEKKPAYRGPIRRRRCLIPADGWYEWRTENGAKQPYLLHLPNHAPVLLAGVWDRWRNPDGEPIDSASIITTQAEGPPSEVHSRMPVIAPMDGWRDWLSSEISSASDALALLDPTSAAALVAFQPVSRYVNNARNEGPQCVAPAEVE